MKKQVFSIILAFVLLFTLLSGCTTQPQNSPNTSPPTQTSTQTPEKTPTQTAPETTTPDQPPESSPPETNFKKLTVGTMALSMGVPVQYAYEKGFYSDEGLDIEIILFATGVPINEAYAAGQLDVAVSGMASVYSLANGRAKWVGEINTTGGLGIFVRPDSPVLSAKGQIAGKPNMYGSADIIKNMKILGPLGTASQFNAIRWAQQFGLTSADYEHVHMEFGAAYQAFLSGEGDAVTLNPPFSFQAEEAGYICAATFEDATESTLMDGIFCTDNMYNNRREELVRFIRATYKAQEELQDYNTRFDFSLRWFNENGKEYTENSLAREISVREYIYAGNMTKPGYVFGKGMTEIAGFFVTDGKIQPRDFPNVQASFADDIIKEALGISFEVDR